MFKKKPVVVDLDEIEQDLTKFEFILPSRQQILLLVKAIRQLGKAYRRNEEEGHRHLESPDLDVLDLI